AVSPTHGTGQWTIASGTATIINASSPETQLEFDNNAVRVAWTVSTAGCPPSVDYLNVVPITISENELPNVITPNGDGKNDVWTIKNIELVPNTIRMYDRWGKSVFEASDYKNNWSGGSLSAGSYYYYLSVPSCNVGVKGILNILD
ncbi:MAG TPA: gliding motility-associated C-terminal domain-containing protein, partial [Cyclobacteriaceae bacterium]|nr:gliding motility-associated C-terminal domain-containing protein [Cyclobacteriaceae bacterium]